MKIICTICSKQKSKDSSPLLAWERYTSPRIALIKEIANKSEIQFFIMSGKFGLISEGEKIAYYNELLTKNNYYNLIQLVTQQIIKNNITEILFYNKQNDPKWALYREVLEKSVKEAGAKLVVSEIA